MLAAVHLDNLLFLLFVAIAIFFQILTRAATKGRKRPSDTSRRSTSPSQMARPLPREAEPEESDEDRIRKFLEALGQPTTAKPPGPVAPRTDIPPRPVAPVSPPRGPFVLPARGVTRKEQRKSIVVLQHPPAVELPAASLKEQELTAPEPPPSVVKAAEEAYAIETRPISRSTGSKIDIVTMLRSTSGLRDAIVLREIFGPPRSMQPLDLVSGF